MFSFRMALPSRPPAPDAPFAMLLPSPSSLSILTPRLESTGPSISSHSSVSRRLSASLQRRGAQTQHYVWHRSVSTLSVYPPPLWGVVQVLISHHTQMSSLRLHQVRSHHKYQPSFLATRQSLLCHCVPLCSAQTS